MLVRNDASLNRAARENANWWRRCADLERLIDAEGTVNVGTRYPVYGRWVSKQRTKQRRGLLPLDRVVALEKLGVLWDVPEDRWDLMCEGLRNIARANGGNPNVPCNHPTHGAWLVRQREMHAAGRMPDYRVQALETIGVLWRYVPTWDEMFDGLKAVAAANGGNPNIRQDHPTHGKWLDKQRTLYKAGKLKKERAAKLEALGVVWRLRGLRRKTA